MSSPIFAEVENSGSAEANDTEVASPSAAFGPIYAFSPGEPASRGGSSKDFGNQEEYSLELSMLETHYSSHAPKNAASHLAVVTGFRATAMPEYKGNMPRCGHTAIMYKRDLYIFGGITEKNQYPNYMYRHEKRSLQWEEVRGVGVVPTGRANHSAIMHKNKMIIYGGHRYLEVFDDVYSFDLDVRRWDKIGYEKCNGPGPVFLHAAVYIPSSQTMAIIGGFHQREHNIYVGHFFDIKNRHWSGFTGPSTINLQHIQLVTASFDHKSSSIVVLGFIEKNTPYKEHLPPPFVYMMNTHSLVWTRVDTTISPESPIPFRLDLIWEKFMREFVMLGGYFEFGTRSWFFPTTIESALEVKLPQDAASSTSSLASPPKSSRVRYGFFMLQLEEMKWSIVPTALPNKLIADLAQKNRDKILQNKTNAPIAFLMRGLRSAPSSINPKSMLHNLQNSVPEDSASQPQTLTTEDSPQQKVMLFSVINAPQFQRKYAYAANYDSGVKKKKSKSMQYFIMHGGLEPGMDYTMLMFTAKLSRPDVYTAARIEMEDGNSSIASRVSSDEESRSLTFKRNFTPESTFSSPIEQSKSSFRVDEESENERCLLPLLPCTQSKKNMHRFAIMFHPSNAIKNEALLPYAGSPAAILEASEDIRQWSERYYSDSRKWVCEKLEKTVLEEKKFKKIRKQQKKKTLSLGIDASSSSDNSSSTDDVVSIPSPARASPDEEDQFSFSPVSHQGRSIDKQVDFFKAKGLHVFGLEDFDLVEGKTGQKPKKEGTGPQAPREEAAQSDRMSKKIKRHEEKQRLTENVFIGEHTSNLGDMGSAMSFVLMQNALSNYPDDSPEDRVQRARIRWNYLRALVRTGEAAFVIYHVSQDEALMKGHIITSNPTLLLAPELHLIGPVQSYKVSSRPVPYNIRSNIKEGFAEVSKSGMILYHRAQNFM